MDVYPIKYGENRFWPIPKSRKSLWLQSTPHFLPHPGLNCCFFSIVAYALLQFWINHPNLASETFNGKWNIKHLVPCFTFFEKGDSPYWCFPVPSLYPMVTVHRHRMAIAIEVIVSYRHNLPRCTRAEREDRPPGWSVGTATALNEE